MIKKGAVILVFLIMIVGVSGFTYDTTNYRINGHVASSSFEILGTSYVGTGASAAQSSSQQHLGTSYAYGLAFSYLLLQNASGILIPVIPGADGFGCTNINRLSYTCLFPVTIGGGSID